MNVDAMIAARRAELLATVTGQAIAADHRPGTSFTPGEIDRRRTAAIVRRHGSTANPDMRLES